MAEAVDAAVLAQLAEDLAPEDVAEVVRRYVLDSGAMLRAMTAGRDDISAWQRAAHRLAGGAGGVGATTVEAMARALMDAPLPADPAAVLAALGEAIDASCEALAMIVAR